MLSPGRVSRIRVGVRAWNSPPGSADTADTTGPAGPLSGAIETHLRTRMKYMSPTGWLSEVILTQRDRDVWSWFHWDQTNRFSNLKQVQTEMRAYGIRREDRIISVPDPSPNITLSLLDQKGFTNLYDENMTGDERIEFYVQKGASYLVCNSMEWFDKRSESPWLQHPIIELEGMMVFDLLNSEAPLRDHARK